jgi:hypothetical protein
MGYFLIGCGFVECASGITEYFKEIDPEIVMPLTTFNVFLTSIMIFYFEFEYQKSLKSDINFNIPV